MTLPNPLKISSLFSELLETMCRRVLLKVLNAGGVNCPFIPQMEPGCTK